MIVGKNDGSVGGTRYFQCEPKKGVFARLTRLTRVPLEGMGSGDTYTASTPSPVGNGTRGGPLSPTGSAYLTRASASACECLLVSHGYHLCHRGTSMRTCRCPRGTKCRFMKGIQRRGFTRLFHMRLLLWVLLVFGQFLVSGCNVRGNTKLSWVNISPKEYQM